MCRGDLRPHRVPKSVEAALRGRPIFTRDWLKKRESGGRGALAHHRSPKEAHWQPRPIATGPRAPLFYAEMINRRARTA